MNEADSRLQIDTLPDGGGAVLRITGDLNMHTCTELRARLLELIEQQPGRLIVDLSGVGYIDSSGVSTMIEAKRRLERAGGRIVLAGLQARVRSVFEIAKLDRYFKIAPGVEEARGL